MLAARVQAYAERHRLWSPGARVVAGVSGGLDSAVLLDVLVRLGLSVTVAHVNYGLRGAESDADETSVRARCQALGVACRVHRATPAGSVQAEARTIRYRFFRGVAEDVGAEAVAVAHHRDDQAETVLLHLLRGTGAHGLSGMSPARSLAEDTPVRLVRPLLDVSREAIRRYADEHELTWREDATNAQPAYLRNRVRHELVPLLEALAPGATDRIAGLAERLHARVPSPGAPSPDRVRAHPRGAVVPLSALAAPGAQGLIAEALRVYLPEVGRSAAVIASIANLAGAQVGRRIEAGGLVAWRERDQIAVLRAEPPPAFVLPVGEGETVTPLGRLVVTRQPRPERPVGDAHAVWLPAGIGPLTIRPWKAGDAFRPLGMRGHKRVSDVLTDRRVPPSERDRQVVLCAGESVVWVVGHRLGEAARLGERDPDALRVCWRPGGP